MAEPETLLSTRLPDDLVSDARELIDQIRRHENPKELRREGAAMVQRLTAAGLEAFFLEPVRRLELGLVTQSMVKVGLASAGKAIGLFVKRIVGGLSSSQVLRVADLIDEMLLDRGNGR